MVFAIIFTFFMFNAGVFIVTNFWNETVKPSGANFILDSVCPIIVINIDTVFLCGRKLYHLYSF